MVRLTATAMDERQPATMTPALTDHARQRMAQRNMSCKDVGYIMDYGQVLHRSGAVFIHLGHKDIPTEDRGDPAIARLEGATVVLGDSESVVLTVWRNREQGLRHIRRKR